MRISFVTWDGPGQTYLEGLFLPIFARTQTADISFSTLQFSWGPPDAQAAAAKAAERYGILYEGRRVLRRPLKTATTATVLAGAVAIVAHARRHGTSVLMPRSIIPAAMTLIARRFLPGVKLIFDADGFMADERVDFAGWHASSLTYRLFRDVEAEVCRRADAIVTRTNLARRILIDRAGAGFSGRKVHVIPNARDIDEFTPGTPESRAEIRQQEGVPPTAPWIIYAGSLGPQYMPERMVEFCRAVLRSRPDARVTLLTGNQDAGRQLLARAGLPKAAVKVRSVSPAQVARYLAAADVGMALRAPSYSQQGVCPIKVAEYLLCGLPVLATAGVGDLDTQVSDSVGLVLESTTSRDMERAARDFLETVLPNRETYREECRKKGVALFGLGECADRLRAVIARCQVESKPG